MAQVADPGFGRRAAPPAHAGAVHDPGFRGAGAPPPRRAARAPQRPVVTHVIDPFAPITSQQVAQRQAVYGPVYSDQQIQHAATKAARAQIAPLLAMITKEIATREGNAQKNLGQATSAYVDAARGYAPAVDQGYQQAEQNQANVDAALSQQLSGGGTALAQQLASKLAAAGQSTAPADAVAQTGQGAGGAALASGSADLSRLLADQASAREYGARLPVIAANTGASRAAQLGSQYETEQNSRTQQISQQLPSLIQGLVQSLSARNEARRQNRATVAQQAENEATQNAVFRKEYGLKAQTEADSAANAQARVNATNVATRQRANAAATSATERQRHDQATESVARQRAQAATAAAQRQGRQLDPNLSGARGIAIGKDGKPIYRWKVKNGHRVPGSQRTIPYPKKKASGSSSSSSSAPPWSK